MSEVLDVRNVAILFPDYACQCPIGHVCVSTLRHSQTALWHCAIFLYSSMSKCCQLSLNPLQDDERACRQRHNHDDAPKRVGLRTLALILNFNLQLHEAMCINLRSPLQVPEIRCQLTNLLFKVVSIGLLISMHDTSAHKARCITSVCRHRSLLTSPSSTVLTLQSTSLSTHTLKLVRCFVMLADATALHLL